MAIPRIKGTYSLDPETIRTLETLAKRWGTSKSEVLRRAVRAAAAGTMDRPDLAALDQLQGRIALSASAARDERRSR